jgi:hypothetical protein
MNIKKMLLVVAVLGLVAFMATSVFATEDTYTGVSVLQAGDLVKTVPGKKKVTPSIQLRLTGGTGALGGTLNNLTAYAVKGQENRMLAVALTAMANGSTVTVIVDPLIASPTVYKMNLEGAAAAAAK